MIVPKEPHLWRMLTYVGPPLWLMTVWDVAVVVAYNGLGWTFLGLGQIPVAVYGTVIGLVVGFRNNSAYSRWWEARKLWGAIVNESRSLGRQVCVTLDTSPSGRPPVLSSSESVCDLRQRLIYHQIAWVHALRQHLRGVPVRPAIDPFLSEEEAQSVATAPNPPLAIQLRIAAMLRDARDRNWINALEWQAMDESLNHLTDAQGGSERIKNTPIPKQYDFFPMLFVRVYCALLPCAMVPQLGWLTPLGSTLIGFMFLALEKIGRDLENPFENSIHDIPLTSICRTIEIGLRHMLGEGSLPEPVKPEFGVLW